MEGDGLYYNIHAQIAHPAKYLLNNAGPAYFNGLLAADAPFDITAIGQAEEDAVRYQGLVRLRRLVLGVDPWEMAPTQEEDDDDEFEEDPLAKMILEPWLTSIENPRAGLNVRREAYKSIAHFLVPSFYPVIAPPPPGFVPIFKAEGIEPRTGPPACPIDDPMNRRIIEQLCRWLSHRWTKDHYVVDGLIPTLHALIEMACPGPMQLEQMNDGPFSVWARRVAVTPIVGFLLSDRVYIPQMGYISRYFSVDALLMAARFHPEVLRDRYGADMKPLFTDLFNIIEAEKDPRILVLVFPLLLTVMERFTPASESDEGLRCGVLDIDAKSALAGNEELLVQYLLPMFPLENITRLSPLSNVQSKHWIGLADIDWASDGSKEPMREKGSTAFKLNDLLLTVLRADATVASFACRDLGTLLSVELTNHKPEIEAGKHKSGISDEDVEVIQTTLDALASFPSFPSDRVGRLIELLGESWELLFDLTAPPVSDVPGPAPAVPLFLSFLSLLRSLAARADPGALDPLLATIAAGSLEVTQKAAAAGQHPGKGYLMFAVEAIGEGLEGIGSESCLASLRESFAPVSAFIASEMSEGRREGGAAPVPHPASDGGISYPGLGLSHAAYLEGIEGPSPMRGLPAPPSDASARTAWYLDSLIPCANELVEAGGQASLTHVMRLLRHPEYLPSLDEASLPLVTVQAVLSDSVPPVLTARLLEWMAPNQAQREEMAAEKDLLMEPRRWTAELIAFFLCRWASRSADAPSSLVSLLLDEGSPAASGLCQEVFKIAGALALEGVWEGQGRPAAAAAYLGRLEVAHEAETDPARAAGRKGLGLAISVMALADGAELSGEFMDAIEWTLASPGTDPVNVNQLKYFLVLSLSNKIDQEMATCTEALQALASSDCSTSRLLRVNFQSSDAQHQTLVQGQYREASCSLNKCKQWKQQLNNAFWTGDAFAGPRLPEAILGTSSALERGLLMALCISGPGGIIDARFKSIASYTHFQDVSSRRLLKSLKGLSLEGDFAGI